MALDIAALSTKLGLCFGGIKEVNDFLAGDLTTRETTLRTEYGTDADGILDGLSLTYSDATAMARSYASSLAGIAQQTLVSAVEDDTARVGISLTDALAELYFQFRQADTLADCPATASIALDPVKVSAGTVNTGTPTFVLSIKDETGRNSDFLIPDIARIDVLADRAGGATEFSEALQIRSQTSVAQALDPAYPSGAGLNTSISLIDPATNYGIVADGVFSGYASGEFTSWDRPAGITSTHAYQTSLTTAGPRSDTITVLTLKGAAGIVPRVTQEVSLLPNTRYHYVIWARTIARPTATDKITVSLRNATSNAVLTNDVAAELSETQTLSAAGGAWEVKLSGEFITPRYLPTSAMIDVRIHGAASVSTAAATNAEVQITYCSLQPGLPLYSRGLTLTAFSGATAVIDGDAWRMTTTLTTGTVSDYFVRWLDRVFGIAGASYRWPTSSSGGETVSDSLIT